MAKNMFIVLWSIDYSWKGEGRREGVELFEAEEDALSFIRKGVEADKPRDEVVYPHDSKVTLHHPGFEAIMYKAEEVREFLQPKIGTLRSP